MITLEEITPDNLHAVLALEVSDSQKAFYPRSNAHSIAEGFFPPDDDPVWMRAISHDGKPVGFMMTSEVPERGEYFLWRMMIDKRFQGKSYGAKAMQLLINRVQNNGNATILLLSHLKANLAAGRFYSGFGFQYTGEDLSDNELSMSREFGSSVK